MSWSMPSGRLLISFGAAAVAGWATFVGYRGSNILMRGDGTPHGCRTPAFLGWRYEAVNYDVALDELLEADNADWLHDCPRAGTATAGPEVVSADGARIAGWYIPSARGDPPDAPTVVIVHGWGVSKSDSLRYAIPLHDRWNLLLLDTRARGRSSGEWMSVGVREADDVRAMLDWLERAKRPSWMAVIGDSGGASAAARLARTDERIAALVLESPVARLRYGLEARFGTRLLGRPVALTSRIVMAAVRLRTGVRLSDADPIDSVGLLGRRPLAISYGTDEETAIPARNALALFDAAKAAGVPVEIHACEGARHGLPIDVCREAYTEWLNGFLERAWEDRGATTGELPPARVPGPLRSPVDSRAGP